MTSNTRIIEDAGRLEEILKIDPKFTLEIFKGVTMDFKDPAHAEKYAGDLRKAGIPEK